MRVTVVSLVIGQLWGSVHKNKITCVKHAKENDGVDIFERAERGAK